MVVLQKSFDLDESMRGDIVEIKDEFAVGPIKNIYTEKAIEARKHWWRAILAGGDYDGIADDGHVNDQKTVQELLDRLQNNTGK